jgi:hypothetical protein
VQSTYDRGDLDNLPGSTVGFARSADSDGTISVDNRAAIIAALTKHNTNVMTMTNAAAGGDACSVTGRSRRSALPIVALGVLAWAARRRRRRDR